MAKKIAIGTKEIIVPEKQDIKNQISEYGGFTTLDYTLTAGDFEGDLAKIEMPINENTKLYVVGETENLKVESISDDLLILKTIEPIIEDREITIVYSNSAIMKDSGGWELLYDEEITDIAIDKDIILDYTYLFITGTIVGFGNVYFSFIIPVDLFFDSSYIYFYISNSFQLESYDDSNYFYLYEINDSASISWKIWGVK